jgi:hypothetical protein
MLKRLLFVVAAASSCADPSGPTTHAHPQRVLIAGTEEGAVVVDLDWRGIIRRSGPRLISQGPAVLNGRDELITVGRLEGGATVIAGLDVQTGLELWRTAISQNTTPIPIDGTELGATVVAANPSRSEVFLWRSVQNGVGGIAGFDYNRRKLTRFIGPLVPGHRLRALASTPATVAHPDGCVVLALDSGGGQIPVRAFLHVVCGSTYQQRDSIGLALPSRIIGQMELTPDKKHLLVMSDIEFLKFDVETFAVKVKATRPMTAPFFLARATGRVIVPDVGSSVVASTGIIYLLDANLELSSIIDLRVLPFVDRPLGILGAEESADGRWLYIVGGVPRDGPLYGPEPTHILVIDKSSGLVVDTIDLDTFGGVRAVLVQ